MTVTVTPSPFEGPDVITIDIDSELYSTDVIFRVAYDFTDKFFVFLSKPNAATIRASLARKHNEMPLGDVAGAFVNALIDQRVRQHVADETKTIRELLVAQAFAEADLLDRRATEADYSDDPRGITR